MLWNSHLLFFYVGSIAAAAVLDRRQAPRQGPVVGMGPNGRKQTFGYPFDLERLAPPMKPLSKTDLKARYRSNSIRKMTKYGPFTLPAAKVGAKASEHSHGMMGGKGGASKNPSSPKTLMDLIPGAPALTWDHISRAYQFIKKGDYESAIDVMLKVPQDGEGTVMMRSLKEGFCSNCTILAIKTDVVNEDESRMDISNGVYLHHAVSINLGWRDMSNWLPACPELGPMMKTASTPARFQTPVTMFGNTAVDEFQQWFGSPTERSTQGGMYVSPLDFILLQAEMINYTQKEKKVYINFDYEYVPGRMGKETTFTMASTIGCGGLGFYNNGNKTGSVRSKDFEVLQSGTILAFQGHLHDGGEKMIVYLNEKVVCETKAIYGTKLKNESGKEWTTISEVTQCTEPVKVNKGDRIALETTFDEIAHPLRESTNGNEAEQMGIMHFTFVED